MLKSRKHVFWEALVVTILIFLTGLFLGMLIETSNSNKISQFYIMSEISLTDAMASASLTESIDFDCDVIKKSNIDFANRVYEEASILEDYEESGRLSENLKSLHKKYDLLRTLIWASNQDSLERCKNYNLVVYLYEAESENTVLKAKQNVWSKILLEVKRNNEDNVLLLPIAANQNLSSFDLLASGYNIENLPALIINNKEVIHELENAETVEQLLD